MKGWIEIFRAGVHTDSAGTKHAYTEEDLDAIVKNYDPAAHEAPIVVGHPKDNHPAFGWVESLKRDGKVLLMKVKDVVPEFADAVKQGLYKKRSISLYPDLSLRHVGFLGAMPPAVKGLADIAFKDDDKAVTFEFNEGYKFRTLGWIMQGLRDFFIEKEGIEKADKLISQWQIDDIKREEIEPDVKGFHEPHKEGTVDEKEKKALEEKLNAEFAEKMATKDAEIAALKKEKEEKERADRAAGFASFADGLIADGKLLPAHKETVQTILEVAHAAGSAEFAEGDKKVQKPVLDAFKGFLSAMPVSVEFREIASKASAGKDGRRTADFTAPGADIDPDKLEDHRKIEALAKEKNVSYAEAAVMFYGTN